MVQVRQRLGVSERRACRVLGQARSTQRRIPKRSEDEEALREDVVKVARRFGRYGYRMVTGMLRTEGWAVNHKRVERIWRQEGLKVPSKQPKRGRLWLTDGSCIRLRPLYRHHVWAYDFVADRTHDGRPLKMLTVLDEYSRECLAIVVARRASGGRCSADAERAVCRARSTGESSLRQRSGVHGPSGSAVAW